MKNEPKNHPVSSNATGAKSAAASPQGKSQLANESHVPTANKPPKLPGGRKRK